MNGNSSEEFSDEMKSALIEIAKYIIGEEINANLDGIHPVYNSETMTPSWKVDSLLCANLLLHILFETRPRIVSSL